MKTPKSIHLVSVLFSFIIAFCVNTPPTATASDARFHEGKSADIVLEYSSWNMIILTRPDSHEDGFYPILTRSNVAAEINHFNPGRNLAVIVINDANNRMLPEEQAAVIHGWESLLGDCGFHRVVFLRSTRSKNIDGLPIIHESDIADARDDSAKALAANATIPPTH